VNLLSPGDTPYENAQFLLFLCAVIQAVDDYQDLLRISVATAGNDHRLGANEAPPAVVSMFLGDELDAILRAVENDEPYAGAEKKTLKLGADVLPKFPRDTTDRNRTSPFAFTGNKFEFRMVGSADSIACANIMINAAVADSLRQFADELEHADAFEDSLHALIQKVIRDHKRIIFNGNGYDDVWLKEAERRGLCNYRTTADCMPHLIDEKNLAMLERQGVYTETELRARCEANLENYCKTVTIEANTMAEMAVREIMPAVDAYVSDLLTTIERKSAFGGLSCRAERKLVTELNRLYDEIDDAAVALQTATAEEEATADWEERAGMISRTLLAKMDALRAVCDKAETLTAESYWPFPTYGDLLFDTH
ncbi:MAG: glutamine synthetase type III, partial [Clostridia bacterium]|nr:glutamine synthetase type III [Clostridia bacterium]